MSDKPSTPYGLSALALCLLLIGCNKPAEDSKRVGRDFEVERLFEHNGCTAYRFNDGRYVYYVHCHGSRASTQSSYWVSTGKSGYYVDVQTTTDDK